MKQLLADTNWLIKLENELSGKDGPALKLLSVARVHINPMAAAEFLSGGSSLARRKTLARMIRLPALDYRDASRAAHLRQLRAKQGKPLATPDAFMAASAVRYALRLVTADRDFSGIPGLKWSGYRTPKP